jgi:hypothetical protein
LLSPACRTVPGDRVALCPNKVIEPGELHNEGIIVIFEKWLRIQPGRKDGFEIPPSLFLPSPREQQEPIPSFD